MKRIFTLLFVSMIAFAVSAQDLTILHLNDTHSHIDPQRGGKNPGQGGVIEQAAVVDSVRMAVGKKNVLLVHAGDFSQGTSYFSELNGDIEVNVLNAMQFDAVTLGNHEFDNGVAEIARRIRNLDAPVVCANYDFAGTQLEGLVQPYVVVKKSGKKIGIIGLLTDVSTVVDKSVADLLTYMDPIEATNRYADFLKNQKKCDFIVCLSHLGYDHGEHTDCEIAPKLRNVNVIISGHSHTKLDDLTRVKDLDGKDVIIVSDWRWGLEVGQLSIDF